MVQFNHKIATKFEKGKLGENRGRKATDLKLICYDSRAAKTGCFLFYSLDR